MHWQRTLAYMIWEARGRRAGEADDNWLRAGEILSGLRYMDWFLLSRIPLQELVADPLSQPDHSA